MRGKLKHEPLYVDLRLAKSIYNLSLRHSQYRPAVLDISSTLLGRPNDELDGEDVQHHRRFGTIARAVTITLSLLTLLLIVGITGLILQIRETGQKTSQALATQSKVASDEGNHGRALRFAVLAARDMVLSPPSEAGKLQLSRSAYASTVISQFGHEAKVHFASFSTDRTKAVTASMDQTARVWDIHWLTQYDRQDLIEHVLPKNLSEHAISPQATF